MSPRKFLDGDHKQQQLRSGVVINGPRPTPLKVKQESHTIHKQHHHQQQQIKRPIIIYTYSPEVIHTKPHDFMALVQKLTGHSGSKDQEKQEQKTLKQDRSCDRKDNDSNSNDSGVTHQKDKIIKDKSPMFNAPSSPFVADIPLFTPNSSDYFCSTRPFFQFSDMVSSSPNMTTSLSPGSLVELLKGLPEY
ncbi:VQ motif-containing protein 8, chloroplastic [Cynara cardunculus var. scolymus]|uniref:VQ-like protein n=1 Tax=Cynara cardunculus var. scolymus TaxID=59895 RepID=A0A103YA84_CYNCS|nr:VQ motif-containing protein 8, chloroplastic [Cynara cardunculus var. scolymus]KVI05364.1 VQ-like protein [Cynara cardunculus var. scolymus]